MNTMLGHLEDESLIGCATSYPDLQQELSMRLMRGHDHERAAQKLANALRDTYNEAGCIKEVAEHFKEVEYLVHYYAGVEDD